MANASTISRTLRRAGFAPLGSGTSRTREGLRVSGGNSGRVYVAADLDSPRQARVLAVLAAEAVVEAGYEITVVMDNGFAVPGKAS